MELSRQIVLLSYEYKRGTFDLKAARIVKLTDLLEIKEIELPHPNGSQVLIKVQSTLSKSKNGKILGRDAINP
jgi:hypothetical protein